MVVLDEIIKELILMVQKYRQFAYSCHYFIELSISRMPNIPKYYLRTP